MHCSSKVKKKKLFYVALTLNQNILIIFFSFLFFSPLFHFCPLLLSTQSSHFVSVRCRWPSPNPTPTTLCVLHNSTPFSLLSHAQRRCGFVFVFSDLLWAVGLCFLICGHFGAIDEIFRGILFTVFSDVAVVGVVVKIE